MFCAVCASNTRLQIHHDSYEPEITRILCVSCHIKEHDYKHGVGVATGELVSFDHDQFKLDVEKGLTYKEIMTKHSISIMTVWKWKNRVLNKEKDPSQFTVYTKIGLNVKTIADRLAEKMGISLSEYIRWLIINDLKKRTTLTETIKEE